MMSVENVIVGAGPYGLSIAAHFRENNIEALVMGRPMASWREHMPAGMILKSETFASNLSDPLRQFNFEHFYRLRGTAYRPVGTPLAIADFIDYADWFRRQAVPDIRDVELRNLRRLEDGFELALDDGSRLRAKRVILATGYLNFQHMPSQLRDLPAELVTHTAQHRDLARFAGKDVTIVGRGQSGLETAALLREQGANVRILVRAAKVEWNSDPNAARSLIARIRRPEAGLGAGWYSLAISELPALFSRLPLRKRDHIVTTSWGPSGAWWLKARVADKIPVLTSHDISHVVEKNGKLQVSTRSAGQTARFRNRPHHRRHRIQGRCGAACVSGCETAIGTQNLQRIAKARCGVPVVGARSAFRRHRKCAVIWAGHAVRLWRKARSRDPDAACRQPRGARSFGRSATCRRRPFASGAAVAPVVSRGHGSNTWRIRLGIG